MSSEHETELLKISKFDLWRIHQTLFEMLADGGYTIRSPFSGTTFEVFCQLVDDLKAEELKHLLARLEKKTPFGKDKMRGKKPSGETKTKAHHQKMKITIKARQEGKDEKEDGKEEKNAGDDAKSKPSRADLIAERRAEMVAKKFPLKVIESELNDLRKELMAADRKSEAALKKKSKKKKSATEEEDDLSAFERRLIIEAEHKVTGARLGVFFARDRQVGVTAVKQLTKFLKTANMQNVIIVTSAGFTAFAQTPLAKLKEKYAVRTFLHESLLVNSMKHELLLHKAHSRVDELERAQLNQKYSDLSVLPRLLTKDPVAVYNDFRPGDVVRIDCKGGPVIYRLVTND